MSDYYQAAYHPGERVIRAARWIDNYFGHHQYGVKFEDDTKVYHPKEVEIPLDVVFVPSKRVKELENQIRTFHGYARQ